MSFAFSIKKKVIIKKVEEDSDDEDEGHVSKKVKTDARGPPAPPADDEERKVADKLADFVAKNGAQFEEMTRSKNAPAPGNPFRFLHDKSSGTYKYYEWKMNDLKKSFEAQKAREESIKARGLALESYPSAQRPGLAPGAASRPPPERMSRFSERPREPAAGGGGAGAASTSGDAPGSAAGVGGADDDAAAAKAKADSLRLMEMYMKKAAQTDAERLRDEEERERRERIRLGEDPRFKQDGTRAHHMGDYIPQEELQKFMAKSGDAEAAAAAEPEAIQIGEDNKGRQLLAKMGWKEGAGLGAGGVGMTAPVEAGAGNQHGLGIGANAAVEVSESDDIYEQYKKRMMLGYKFRPNPLNNPRKAYY